MKEAVIVAAVRTPLGSFGGTLKNVSAVDLGSLVIKSAIERANLKPEQVDEVIMGNVLGAGLGQNVARQMSVNAGVPVASPAFTINKVCGSGLKAVQLAAQAVLCGDADIVVAGGAENMSQAPYVLPNQRWGARMGDSQVVDTMLRDGLTDAFESFHMGITAENVAEQYGITREDQDNFAVQSQKRAVAAINDGAAAVVVMSADKAKELGVPILATIKSYASAGLDPKVMGCGPIYASRKALEKGGFTVEDLDLVESNEAFAAQACAVGKELNLDPEKVNVNGGAIALGHPIGASGCRILVTLLHEMQKRDAKRGLATLCIGGGMGTAVIVER